MRFNILDKEGMLTDEDRKKPLQHGCNTLMFETCIDLSEPITIRPYSNNEAEAEIISVEQYSRDVAEFMIWWTRNVMVDLNGFSGMANAEFDLVGCRVV